MREAVLIGRAGRTGSPHGTIVEDAGIDALLDGPGTGLDENGNEDIGRLATAPC